MLLYIRHFLPLHTVNVFCIMAYTFVLLWKRNNIIFVVLGNTDATPDGGSHTSLDGCLFSFLSEKIFHSLLYLKWQRFLWLLALSLSIHSHKIGQALHAWKYSVSAVRAFPVYGTGPGKSLLPSLNIKLVRSPTEIHGTAQVLQVKCMCKCFAGLMPN